MVVKEVLKLGTQDFLSIMQLDQFVNALSVLLQRVQEKPEEWGNLIMPTLQHLTNQEILQKYDNNLILLNVMPFLFPAEHNADTQNIIKAVLNSDLAKKIGFLKRLELGNKKKSKEFNLAEFKKHFLDIIAHDQETPDIKQLFESVKMKEENFFKSAAKCNNFLILATAFMQHKLKPAEAKQLFEQMYSFCAEFEIKPLNKNISGKQCDYVVLQLYTDFLSYLIKNTDFELDALKQWHCPSEDLKCFMAIYQQLAEQTFSQQNSEAKLQWSNTLKVLFENIFENPQNKLEFLLNFFVHSELQGVDANDFNAMRIRAFKLTTAILQNKSNKLTLQMEHLIKIIIGLNSSCKITRLEVLQTMKILSEHSALKAQPKTFVQQLLERHEELIMDHEQLPLIMFTLLNEHKKTKSSILNDILKLLGNSCLQEPVFKAQILNLLKHLSDCCIAIQLMCMAEETLQQITHINHIKMIESPYADILLLIMQRFEVQNIENLLMDCQEASKVLTNIFNSYDIYMNVEDKLQPLPCVLLENLDEYVYERMSLTHQNELLANIIQTIAAAENDSIFLAANKLLRKCQLDCNALVKILSQMFTAVAAEQEATPCKQPAKRRHKLSLSLAGNNSKIDINSQNWKQGVALLELLENKKKLQHAEKLIPQLFALLQLTLDHEEQSAVEYSKQLTLSALLHCCRVAQSAGVQLSSALPKTTFRIDQIVQCMRATKNPQTHHNALLLLSHCAVLFPQQVLHNIVDIFTFMGSSVVRHDDAFSFQIINNIIESIIPVLVNADTKQASNDKSNTNPLVVPVLKVFSDIMLDVPEHRRLPLYTKLMQTLSVC